MGSAQKRGHIDLFDDPSWESEEAWEEDTAYERLVVSGFSAKAEWAFLGFSLTVWIGGLVAFVLLSLTLTNAFNPLFIF